MLGHGNTSHSHCSLKNHILITSNNTYMANQRMRMYFIDFLFIQNSLSFATSVTCFLSNTTMKTLVINVAYNQKLIVKTNCKMAIFYQHELCLFFQSCNVGDLLLHFEMLEHKSCIRRFNQTLLHIREVIRNLDIFL